MSCRAPALRAASTSGVGTPAAAASAMAAAVGSKSAPRPRTADRVATLTTSGCGCPATVTRTTARPGSAVKTSSATGAAPTAARTAARTASSTPGSTSASGAAERAVRGAEVLGARRRVPLETRALVERRRHGVEEPVHGRQVAVRRGGQGLLDQVVAWDVQRVDPIHRVAVRACSPPSLRPGVEAGEVEEPVARRRHVAAGRLRERAEEGGGVHRAGLQEGEQVVGEGGGDGAVEAGGQSE